MKKLIVLTLGLFLFHFAISQWNSIPNVNNPICTASGSQLEPQITSDGSDGAIMVWRDDRNGNPDIYVQKISADGFIQWTVNGVSICTVSGSQLVPQLIPDDNGGAIITWRDDRSGPEIYAQRVDANGVVQWTTNGVPICTASGSQLNPQISTDGSGGAIITWRDDRSGPEIYAQRVDANGVVQWTTNGVPICTASGSQLNPQISTDGSGGAIITWRDDRSGPEIYAQRVDANGAVQWTTNGVAICTASGSQLDPQISADGSGGAIITWRDDRSGPEIYAQRVDANGAVQWTTNGVAICTASGSQLDPQISTDGSGGAIITWRDDRSGPEIYAQRVDANGAVQWTTNGVAICTASGSQLDPQICADGSGGAVITWRDDRSGPEIYAQKVDANGAVQWTIDGEAICTVSGSQLVPQIVCDTNGGAIIVWRDDRNSNPDIYASRINTEGGLPIELESFNGELIGNTVKLFWKTINEIDNEYFVMEHSVSGKNFAQIAKINGAGTIYEPQFYSFIHNDPLPGVNYYRLKNIDFNGNVSFSDILSVIVKPPTFSSLKVYPNPVQNRLTIEVANHSIYTVKIIDVAGHVVLEKLVSSLKENLDLSNFDPGIYMLEAFVSGRQFNCKIMKL